jgi:hypothetical protein
MDIPPPDQPDKDLFVCGHPTSREAYGKGGIISREDYTFFFIFLEPRNYLFLMKNSDSVRRNRFHGADERCS